jgi:type I restriction enzyme S subunit
MRKGWIHTELGEHIDLLTGHPFKSAEYSEDEHGIRLLRGDNVIQGAIRWDDARRWPEDKVYGLERYKLSEGDVVIALDRTWVKAGLKAATIKRADLPCMLVQRVARIRAAQTLDQAYLAAIMQSHRFIEMAKSSKTETAIPHISPYDIRQFLVDIPPILEQRKIAEILQTWDDAIEKLEARWAANEGLYKALARRFFQPCHPTFTGRCHTYRGFELGEVFLERNQSGKERDRLLSITMNSGVIDRDEVGRRDTSTDDKSKYKLILPGDIGYNTMRMWQGVSGLSKVRGIVSPAYTVVTPVPNRIVGRYAAHLFKSARMVFDFERYSQGLTSDTWNLKFPAFSKIKVFLPPVDVQEAQAGLLDFMTEEGSVIREQLKALSLQKRGLMQKLLTGEWRVQVDHSGTPSEAKESVHG